MSYEYDDELQVTVLQIFSEAQRKAKPPPLRGDEWRVDNAFRRDERESAPTRDWQVVAEFRDPTKRGELHRLPKDGYVITPIAAAVVDNPCPTCGAPRERREGTQYLVHIGRCIRAA